MRRGDLTVTEWQAVKALLATARSRRGRPPEQTRAVINGILWRLRTGAPWRDIPARYGDWNKIYRRFRRWSQSGVWISLAVVVGDLAADGEGKRELPSARADIRINRRLSSSGQRFAKGEVGPGLGAARREARIPAGLPARRAARSAAR